MTSSINLAAPALEERIQPGLVSVETLLKQAVVGSRDLVNDLTSHLADAGGKRLRPVLTLVCAQLGAPHRSQSEQVIKSATAIEMTHLASLYHDDVMDSAPTRRGAPSAQHIWGNNRAILAGDVLFSRASLLVADLGTFTVQYHAGTFERMCVGQLNETFGPEEGQDPVDCYLQVLSDKTGALVAAAAYMGAYHAGAGEEIAQIVEAFGEKIGVAFQIADDVIDLCSEADVSGKTPGTDLREGVDTLPVLLLRRAAAVDQLDADGYEILRLLEEDLSSDQSLATVVQMLRDHPVMNETRDLAQTWADEAIAVLDPLPESEAKEALIAFAQLMVNRSV